MESARFVCVHGHFYQPPRENPWLDDIETQDAAFPYHDWNERITAECYGPMAAARILGKDGVIERIVNNYARMSFNFGPTLLTWLERHAPDVYAAILAADRESRERFDGHGSAIAQAYGHAILPLCSPQDKRTHVLWGIRDFEARFGRRPEGMWLPETAVDTATLEALAEQGIAFTILAPHQARRVRHPGSAWQEVNADLLDTGQPYLVRLPSGRSISAFFYHGRLSHAVAFERLLVDGAALARQLVEAAGPGDVPRLANIATDGETYGHHHRFGEMGLAFALDHLIAGGEARVVNYAQYLAAHPPRREVQVRENSSWSCAHGVERWRADCGCNTGAHPQWNQRWRAPLRQALDWLRDELAWRFERGARGLLPDPWSARDGYIEVILDRSPAPVRSFLEGAGMRPLNEVAVSTSLKLLEMQRQALLMYVSCAWFFDDLAGIETTQALLHAGRAVQLAEELFEDAGSLEGELMLRLAAARSNLAAQGDGAAIYRRYVIPARVDQRRVAAHCAVSSVFREARAPERVGIYAVEPLDWRVSQAGRTRLVQGRIRIRCDVDFEEQAFYFAVLHLGDQNLTGGLAPDDSAAFESFSRQVRELFSHGDFTAAFRAIDEHFGDGPLSIRSLFRDEQRRVLRQLVQPVLDEAEESYRHLYEEHISLLRFLASFEFPLPNRLRMASEVALSLALGRALGEDDVDEARIRAILEEARLVNVEFEAEPLSLIFQGTLERLAHTFEAEPENVDNLARLEQAAKVLAELPFGVNLWRVQNIFYVAARRLLSERRPSSEELTRRIVQLGRAFNLAISE